MLKSSSSTVNKSNKPVANHTNRLTSGKGVVSPQVDLSNLDTSKIKPNILKKDKEGGLDQETLSILASTVLAADPTYDIQVAQTGLEGLAAAAGGTGAGAAGAAGAAAGAAGAAGAAAATVSAAVASTVTATTVATTAAVSTTSTIGVAAGVAAAGAAAAGGGGGGGGSAPSAPSTPPPVVTPPPLPSGPITVNGAGPYTGGPSGPNTLVFPSSGDPAWNLSSVPVALYNVSGSPGNPLNKSLVLDLTSPVDANGFQVFFYTQNPGNTNATEYTTVGYYKNFQNVTGTIKNDMISGNLDANVINAGLGDNIVYGGGGADTLSAGSGLNDWVVFKPVTRANTSDNIYTTNLNVDLVHGTYSYGVLTVNGTISGFENVLGSDGNDVILGDSNNNILVGGNGEDIIHGGAGNDVIYGGSSTITGLSGPWHGNQVWGDAGSDTFMVGYNYDPVKASQNNAAGWQTEVAGTDVIRDWDSQSSARDTLVVSSLGTAVIGGLTPNDGSTWVNWSGNDTVDLRSGNSNFVINNGTIVVAAGAGTNTIYASTGKDVFYVGYEFLPVSNVIDGLSTPSQAINSSTTLGAVAHDTIWGWDDQSSNRDTLYVSQGDTAIIASLTSPQVNWNGNDTVDLRSQVANSGTIRITTGLGSNTVYGSSGNDIIYGGSGTGNLNQVVNGGSASNNLNQFRGNGGSDVFNVGYDYGLTNGVFANPSSFDAQVSTISTDIIWDWGNLASGNGLLAQDTLNVNAGSIAIIGGLAGNANWNGNDLVDLSTNVNNSGTIIIAGGAGYDHIIGSHGNDIIYGGSDLGYDIRTIGSADGIVGNDMPGNQVWGNGGANTFYVGYNYDPLSSTPTTALTGNTYGTDVIWDWNDQSAPGARDSLYVSPNGTAIIGGLASTGTNWSGNDLVDLRNQVYNQGKIIVSTGAGNDTIYGSNGTDWIFGGTGLNYVDLGGSTSNGSDRIYIDSFQSKYNVVGFTSQDTIYIDQRIVDAFGVAKSWGPIQFDTQGNPTGYGWIDRSALDPNTYYRNDLASTSVASVDPGQSYTYGPVSGLLFNGVYNATLGAMSSSNGAYSNLEHYGAVVSAKAAVGAAAGVLLGVAAGMYAIPFVGPLLAIPFVVLSGILTYENIALDFRHMNPFYNVGDANSQLALPYLTMMKNLVDPTVSATPGTWDNPSFLSFYNPPNDGYVPTLEVQTGLIRGLHNSAWAGIHSIIALETGLNTATTADDKTFIYLVNSPDGMIQNNETILLAEVNGHLTPDQIKFYNGGDPSDPSNLYLNNGSIIQPILPPQINLGLLPSGSSNVLGGYVRTNSTSSTFQIALSAQPSEVVTVNLYHDGVATPVYTSTIGPATSSTDPVSGWKYDSTIGWYHDVTLQTLVSGNYHVDVVGSQGFVNTSAFQLVIDTQAPSLTSVSATSSSILFSTDENGTLSLGGSSTSTSLSQNVVGHSAAIAVAPQGAVTVFDKVTVADDLGNTATVNAGGVLPIIVLGTANSAGDTIDQSLASTKTIIYGFDGNDTITGSAYDDQIFGGAGNDVIYGGAGNDIIDGGSGNNTIDGGSGNNTVVYSGSTSAVTVNLSTHTATHDGTATDTLTNIQNIVGSAYNDTLTGDSNNNIFTGGTGNNTITGGGGSDTVSYSDAAAGVTVNLVTGSATHDGYTDVLSGIQNIIGSAYNDTFTGGAGSHTIDGGAGSNTVNYSGNSTGITVAFTLATTGNPTPTTSVIHNGGTDTLTNIQNIIGTAYGDTLTGDANDNTFTVGAGSNTIDGGSGSDTVSYSGASAGVTVVLSSGAATVTHGTSTDHLTNIENIVGTAYDDTLTGDANNNTFTGGAGNNIIDGGAGSDTVSYSDASAGVTVSLNGATGTATHGVYTDQLANIENIIGSSFNDTLISGSGSHVIDGGAGSDTVSYAGAAAGVTVDLSSGTAAHDGFTDTLSNVENITGSNFGDALTGNSNDNIIIGGSGNDIINGGGGNDTLTGGGGNNTFVFSNLSSSSHATVTDFVSTKDSIQLSQSAFAALSAVGALSSSQFESGAITAATLSTTRIIYDTAHGNLYYDADGSGTASSAVLVATFTGNPLLDVTKFSVIA